MCFGFEVLKVKQWVQEKLLRILFPLLLNGQHHGLGTDCIPWRYDPGISGVITPSRLSNPGTLFSAIYRGHDPTYN